MAIVLTIGGADKTSLLLAGSLRISDELNSRNTCEFTLLDPAGAYRPAVGQEVILTDGATRLFAGTVDEIEEAIPPGTTALEVRTVCVDYNQLCDRHLVARVYENQTLGAIVRDIVTQDLVGEGITTSHVQDGPVITKATFNYQSVAEAFNDLAELTGYAWNIDYNKDLHFFARETYLAPFELSDTSANFRSMVVRLTREQYRNRQYIRAGQDITDPRTEQFPGDGTTKTFVLAFPVAKVPTVKVNGVAKTIGIRGLDTGKDWYWSKGEKEITQDDAATALTSADTLAVTYQGLFPIILASQADAEISSRSQTEGGTGVYEAIEDDQSIDSQILATQKADGLLRRFGRIPRIVEFETDTAGLAAGQLLTINVTKHNLSGQFLVDSVQAQDVEGQFLRYRVRALDGERLGGWVEFFQRLAQAGRKFVIRENEVLVLLRRFADALVLGDQLTLETKAADSAKVTQFPYFSRSSAAYLSDGTQVAANVPRFEQGQFDKGVVAEEATLYLSYNMLPLANAYLYVDMTNVSDYVVQAGDYLEYDVFWPTNTPINKQIAVDLITSDNLGLRDTGAVDQNGLKAHPNTDISAYASGKWHRRKIPLPSGWVGKTVAYYDLACEYNDGGSVQALVRNIAITDGAGTVRQTIWRPEYGLPTFAVHLTSNSSQSYNITRIAPEYLNIPSAGVLSANQGTVEFNTIPQTDAVLPIGETAYNDFTWGNPGSNGFLLRRFYDGTNWQIMAEFYTGSQILRLNYTQAWTRGERLYVAYRWSSAGCAWFVNGAPRASSSATFAAPTTTTAQLGYRPSYRQGNALYDDFRISSVARTDAEIAAAYQSNAPLPVDEYTTLKLPFDGNLYFRPASEVGFAEVA